MKLFRVDTKAQIASHTGGTGANFGFSLAPGATTNIKAIGAGGSISQGLSSSNRSYFVNPNDVALQIQAIGAKLTLANGLSLTSSSGSIQQSAYVTVQYTYTSNNTTPPTKVTPIVISSSTPATLSAEGEVDWYSFQYAGGALTIDTLGPNLSPLNDTQIALFNSTGGVVKSNDDISVRNGNYLMALMIRYWKPIASGRHPAPSRLNPRENPHVPSPAISSSRSSASSDKRDRLPGLFENDS